MSDVDEIWISGLGRGTGNDCYHEGACREKGVEDRRPKSAIGTDEGYLFDHCRNLMR